MTADDPNIDPSVEMPAGASGSATGEPSGWPPVADESLTATVPAPPAPAMPVAPAERIEAVDVLRGFALLGILTMNIVAMAWPFAGYEDPRHSGGDDPANRAAWLLNATVFSGKMMTLFSMLFGAGLVLMADRAARRGASVRGVYYRRTLWLLVFGLIHGYLIWFGDILFFYAICGLLLYPLRRLPPRWLIGLGVALLLVGSAIGLGFTLFAGLTEQAALQVEAERAAGRTPTELQVALGDIWREGLRQFARPTREEMNKEIAIYRGSYADILPHRAESLLMFQIFGLLLFMLWGIGGRMLLGMGLMKLGVFSAERSERFYRLLAALGYGIGLPLTLAGALNILAHDFEALDVPWGALVFGLGMVPTALGHAAVLLLICKAGALTWLTRPLAAVGRMALTNYLLQSLICTTVFYGYGLGLFGSVDRVGLWLIVLAVWALQLVISPLWLRAFRFGPAEWLWRTLSYWELQPMRKSQTTNSGHNHAGVSANPLGTHPSRS